MSIGYDELRAAICDATPEDVERFARSLSDADSLALLEEVVSDLAAEKAHEIEATLPWRSDPVRMANHLTRGRIELWRYAVAIGEFAARIMSRGGGRGIVNAPTQYGKSTLTSQWGSAWHLDRWPDRNLILTSYADELADANALAVRDILEEHSDVLRARLRRDQRRQDRFSTPEGGGVLSGGITARATGFPAHGVIIDDPFKDWTEAHSAARREKVWNQYRAVFRQRLTSDDAWILIVMTRWHEHDLTGRLMQEAWDATGEEFEVLRLPEIAEAPEPNHPNRLLRLPDALGREPGEILEPKRFSMSSVKAKQLTLGSYLFAGMAQQRPAPAEGTEILREWFNLVAELPRKSDYAISSWDTKLKDKEQGDYVCGQLWWRVGGSYWLLDLMRGQWDLPTTKCAIATMAVRHPEIRQHVIEYAANAPEVIEQLQAGDPSYEISDRTAGLLGLTDEERAAVQLLIRRGMSSLVGKPVKGDKQVRMRAVTPIIEGRNVFLPESALWVPAYLEEMAAFPHGSHDDQVDPTSQALSHLSKASKVKVTNPARSSWGSQSVASGGSYRNGA